MGADSYPPKVTHILATKVTNFHKTRNVSLKSSAKILWPIKISARDKQSAPTQSFFPLHRARNHHWDHLVSKGSELCQSFSVKLTGSTSTDFGVGSLHSVLNTTRRVVGGQRNFLHNHGLRVWWPGQNCSLQRNVKTSNYTLQITQQITQFRLNFRRFEGIHYRSKPTYFGERSNSQSKNVCS